MKQLLIILSFIVLLPPYAVAQENYRNDINDLVVKEMKSWLKDDVVIRVLTKQNENSSLLSPTDMKIINNKWHGERRKNKRPLMEKVLDNELSNYLKSIKENSYGLFTEIIIIDAYGLNAGQTMVSDSYWQGAEDKWLKTLGSRSYATYVSDMKFDYNTEFFQVEVAFIITENDEPVGVIYAGVNLDQMDEWKKNSQE